MPVLEDICWAVLRRARGESVLSSWLKGPHSSDPPIQNAIPLSVLERELVLKYSKAQIEDSIYFLEKRGYLARHGFHGLTRVAYQLTAEALAILDRGAFADEEQAAFREALLDAKRPEFWGVKVNIGELFRRAKKHLGRRSSDGLSEALPNEELKPPAPPSKLVD